MKFNVPFDKTVIVGKDDEANLPGLAYRHLGDTALWWVLLEYNGLVDPIKDVVVGLTLKIPQRKSLIAYLESSRSQTETTITI